MEKTIEVNDIVKAFNLEVLTAEDELDRLVSKSTSRRPGLEFIDYLDYLPMGHVQVLGVNEIHFLHTLENEERRERIENLVRYTPPCFIVTDNQTGLENMIRYCTERNIPLLRAVESNYEFIGKLDAYLIKRLAPETAIHGVCVNVSGLGVLLRGDSGVGKSETAHSLVGRGHRLVADDMVVLKRLSSHTLLGTHNETNKEFISLRSVGLLNVVRMYGRQAFQEESRIVLDIELTKWEGNSLYNELDVEPKTMTYMDVEIPSIQIQLKPGRDVVGLIEAAVNNWYLKQQGYNAADDFMERLENEQ
ncbi:MAG TPA: HPr(Ser) kinase/phosphatase [Atopostipes sp.]|nr:HPr(Ser) kinase/phosphatase [Atopostipes sp.]